MQGKMYSEEDATRIFKHKWDQTIGKEWTVWKNLKWNCILGRDRKGKRKQNIGVWKSCASATWTYVFLANASKSFRAF